MPPESANDLFDIFSEARDKKPEEAQRIIEVRCGGNTSLKSEVLALLAAHAGAGDFLAKPAAVPRTDDDLRAVGPYTIISRLGEGGFGRVYLAEQQSPIRRRVALKVLKRGMDTDAILRRFRAEKEVLGFLDHPGVAKVYDAGVTEDGRPYFAMQLVEGLPITKYCDDRRLSIRDRLQLFVDVCRAVTHAHTKGVIHRDLKPANILVSSVDEGTHRAVIIDFGVSKSIDTSLEELHTVTGGAVFLGTPEYMSPEQALGVSKDIDIRADVYSLGVVLYELLVGSRPVDASRLRLAGVDAIRKLIAEVEPPTPSSRLASAVRSSDANVRSVAQETIAVRQSTVDQLVRRLQGELDWITMRALARDRESRYESAAEFSRDVENYLNDQPVEAKPKSRAYLLRKFVRRHRLEVGAALAVTLALAVGLGAALWQTHVAKLARDDARESQSKATQLARDERQQRVLAESTQEFWNKILNQAARAYGQDTATVRQALELAETSTLASVDGVDPLGLAGRHQLFANAFFALQDFPRAQHHASVAADLFSSQLGREHERSAIARWDKAITRWPSEGAAILEALQESARDVIAATSASDPANWERMASLASLLGQANRRPEAELWIARIEKERKLANDSPDSRSAAQLEMARAQLAQDPKERVQHWRAAVDILERKFGAAHAEVVEALTLLAFELSYGMKDHEEAARVYEDLVARARKIYTPGHLLIADALKELAACLMILDREDRAEQAAAEAMATFVQLGRDCDPIRTQDLLLGLEQMHDRLRHPDRAQQIREQRRQLLEKCRGKK